jgi:hypothetical protein
MSLIIKKNTTFKIPRTGSFLPSSLGGLALWLKADAGVSTTPEQYISQIIISGAGTTTSNGTYTRASGGLTTFNGPNGNYINNTGGAEWALFDTQLYDPDSEDYGHDSYYTEDFAYWYIAGANLGESPAPSGTITNSPTGITLVTAWSDQSGSGNNATPVDSNPIYNSSSLNGKPSISLTSMNDYIERVFSISINPLGVIGSTAFSVQYVEDVCDAGDDNGPIFGNFGGSEDTFVLAQTHYPYGPDCFVYDAFGTRLRKDQITSPVTIANAWTLYSVKSTDDDWQSFVNGQLMHSDPTNTYSNAIGGDGTLYIGKQNAAGTFNLKGKVAEVIVYNRVLTTPERQQVEAYLNSKYQIY